MFKKKEKVLSVEEKKEEPIFHIDIEQRIPVLPLLTEKEKVDIKYPLIAPYAYAHIYWDSVSKELIYKLEEPELNDHEKHLLSILEEGIKELINISFIGVKEGTAVIQFLEKNIKILLNELGITVSKDTYLKLMYYIYRDFVGLNEIEPLLCDYFVEDIECNGIKFPLYVVHRVYRNLKTNIIYDNVPKLASFVEKLAQKCGKYVSYANPLLDGSLPDGSRCNATYTTDITSRGPTITIRKFTVTPWSPIKLIQMRTVSPEILAYLWLLIEHESNIMVVGGTGSGKTTMLNTLAFFIPPQARIVSIEDTRELNIEHANWLPSVAREGVGLANIIGQKYGEVSLFDLLKESFRQNPDYVIIGEVRGREAYVLFQGMASGHPSFGTMHADDVNTMIRRLETPPINLSPSLVESMDVVCLMSHVKVKGLPARRLKEVVEIISVKESLGEVATNSPFIWDPRTDGFFFKTESKVFNKLVSEYGIPKEKLLQEFRLRTQLLYTLYKKNITDFKEVQSIINEYYVAPQDVLRKYGVIK